MVGAKSALGWEGSESDRMKGVSARGPLAVMRSGVGVGGAKPSVSLDEALANAPRHAAARWWIVVGRGGAWTGRGGCGCLRVGVIHGGVGIVPSVDGGREYWSGGGWGVGVGVVLFSIVFGVFFFPIFPGVGSLFL